MPSTQGVSTLDRDQKGWAWAHATSAHLSPSSSSHYLLILLPQWDVLNLISTDNVALSHWEGNLWWECIYTMTMQNKQLSWSICRSNINLLAGPRWAFHSFKHVLKRMKLVFHRLSSASANPHQNPADLSCSFEVTLKSCSVVSLFCETAASSRYSSIILTWFMRCLSYNPSDLNYSYSSPLTLAPHYVSSMSILPRCQVINHFEHLFISVVLFCWYCRASTGIRRILTPQSSRRAGIFPVTKLTYC